MVERHRDRVVGRDSGWTAFIHLLHQQNKLACGLDNQRCNRLSRTNEMQSFVTAAIYSSM